MFVTTYFFNNGGIQTNYWYPNEDWSKFQWIIIPLHVNENHWSVVFLHRDRKILYLCDPFRTVWNKGGYSAVFSALNKYFADRFDCPENSFSGVSCKMPKQRNSYDCGIFVLGYVKEFLQNPKSFQEAWDQGKDFKSYPSEWASEFREKVRKSLSSSTTQIAEDFDKYFDFKDSVEVALDMSGSGKGIYCIMVVPLPEAKVTHTPEVKDDPIEEFDLGAQTQQSTQYSYDEYSNSQLLLVSDILDQPNTNAPGHNDAVLDHFEKPGVLNVKQIPIGSRSVNDDCRKLLEKVCMAIQENRFISLADQEVAETAVAREVDLDWIKTLDVTKMNAGGVNIKDLEYYLDVQDKKLEFNQFRRCIQRFRLGLAFEGLSPKERTEVSGLKDPLVLLYESRIKKYFISNHYMGKDILRLMNMPWHGMAKNSTIRSLLESQTLEFEKPSTTTEDFGRLIEQIEQPDFDEATEVVLPEYEMFELLGVDILQHLLGNQSVWANKKTLAESLGLNSNALLGWEKLAYKHRTSRKRYECFENWLTLH